MKKLLLGIVAAWLVALPPLKAQNFRGGFGHLYFGPGWNVSTSLQDDLRPRSALGAGVNLSRLEMLGGGGGYALFSNGILLGGSGMGYTVRDATARGQINMSISSGFINFGFLTSRKQNLLSFPYIGVGGYESKLRIKSTASDEPVRVGNREIPFDEYLNLHNQGISFELGWGLQFLTFSVPEFGSKGGFMIGVQAGGYFFVGTEDWHEESSDDLLLGVSNALTFAPYIRLTIGGGGFKKI